MVDVWGLSDVSRDERCQERSTMLKEFRLPDDSDATENEVEATTLEAHIPNLGNVKARIREYYGDTVGDDGRHQFSESSAWAREVAMVIAEARRHVLARLRDGVAAPALVLDVDDTALTTYPYLANNGFGTRQNREVLPAITATRDLAQEAHELGVALFFVSVRLERRRADTLDNLRHVGYPEAAGLYLLPTSPPFPPYLPSPGCTSAEFKTSVRAHIESNGSTIIASIGDQVSDLTGGYAERAFKLPNPMYHTP